MSPAGSAATWRPRWWLAPLGALYLGFSGLHHALFDAGLRRPHRAPLPVLSVGNLTAGGTGKTPAVRWLAQRLAGRGRRVAVVSRGYGGRRAEDPLIVSLSGDRRAGAAEAGDEPAELADDPSIHAVVVGRDRVAAARLAAESGASVALLDDGFQHRRLHRDFDLLLMDALSPWQGPALGLPAGLLREPTRAVRRASAILLTRAPDPLMETGGWLPEHRLPTPLRRALARIPSGSRPVVGCARHRPDGWIDADGAVHPATALAGREVLAVSAIGAPESFTRTLEGLGARVIDHLVWPDHHRFTGRDLERIGTRCQALGNPPLITTAKDGVRWPHEQFPVTVLTVKLEVAQEEALVGRIVAALGGCAKEQS